jgi:MFS family permease
LVYDLNQIQTYGLDISSCILIAVSVLTFILFIKNEKMIENPLLNLSLFKNTKFTAYNLALFFNYLSMYMVLFIMPFYLQKVLHFSPEYVGLILTVSPIVMMLMAPLSGYLSDKIGSRYLAFTGSLIFAFALYSMSQLTIFSTVTDVLWRFALLGTGAAFFQAPNNRAIMATVTNVDSGMVSSIIVTMRNLGMMFAVSVAGLLLYSTISPSTLQSSQLFNLAAYDFTAGMHLIVMFGSFLSILVAFLSLIKIHNRRLTVDFMKI